MTLRALQQPDRLEPLPELPPEVEVVGRRSGLRRRLVGDAHLIVALALVALAVWLLTGQRLALALALAAIPVLAGEAVGIAVVSLLRRRAVLEAIGAGHEAAGLPEIAAVRDQLLARAHRTRLAGRLVVAATEGEVGVTAAGMILVPLHQPARLSTSRHMLDHVLVLLLREPCESARGVALCELLLARGAFRIRGPEDVTRLEHDLQRIRFVLRVRA